MSAARVHIHVKSDGQWPFYGQPRMHYYMLSLQTWHNSTGAQ